MGLIAEAMGLSIFKGAALLFLITTLISSGTAVIQTKRIDSYQSENILLKNQLKDAKSDIVDMIEMVKSGEPQVEVLKKHERKLLEACKDQIRKMDQIEEDKEE